jgi:hypothetical protein
MKLIYQGMLMEHDEVKALRMMPGGQQELALARAECVAGFVMEQLYQYMHREAGLFKRDLTDGELNRCAGIVFDSSFNRGADDLDAYCERVARRIEEMRASGKQDESPIRRLC